MTEPAEIVAPDVKVCSDYLHEEDTDYGDINAWCEKDHGHAGNHEAAFVHKVRGGCHVTIVAWHRVQVWSSSA